MEATEGTLGELIETMRKAEGVTKGELAIAVYSCTSFITRWENGEDISWFKFLEIARELGYMVDIEVKGGAE
jgi:hypothetical protein